jgi:hypothetical protein
VNRLKIRLIIIFDTLCGTALSFAPSKAGQKHVLRSTHLVLDRKLGFHSVPGYLSQLLGQVLSYEGEELHE